MQTPFGTQLYVFNPYSYEYLRSLATETDVFLECIATQKAGECIDKKPQAPITLSNQGADLLPVLARCHANFQAMQWDAGTSQLYQDIDLIDTYLLDVVREEIITAQNTARLDVAMTKCMTAVLRDNIPNDGCLVQHLADPAIGMKRQDYFLYTELQETISVNAVGYKSLRFPTHMIAACLVFTGPSKINVVGANVSESFRRCTNPETVNGEGGLPCELEGYVWSSKSRNAVPVANMHSIVVQDAEIREQQARNTYQEIAADVLKAVASANATWRGNWVGMALFTSEGDWLHQAFDCVILGPYGRADLSPRDIDNKLPALEPLENFSCRVQVTY
jgi:hypothetical protein